MTPGSLPPLSLPKILRNNQKRRLSNPFDYTNKEPTVWVLVNCKNITDVSSDTTTLMLKNNHVIRYGPPGRILIS